MVTGPNHESTEGSAAGAERHPEADRQRPEPVFRPRQNAVPRPPRDPGPRHRLPTRRGPLLPDAALLAGFLGEAEHPLADDVALDLGGAAPDRLGAGEEERRH